MGRTRRRWGVACAAIALTLALSPVSVAVAVGAPVAHADGETTGPSAFDFVADPVTGYNVFAKYYWVTFVWEQSTEGSETIFYKLAVDGVVVKTVPQPSGLGTNVEKSIELTQGTHTVSVTAEDSAGNQTPATHTLNVLVDKTPPVFDSGPTLQIRRGPVSGSSVPLRFTWQVSDPDSGIDHIQIGRSDSITLPATQTSYDFNLPLQSERSWQVAAFNGVGSITKQSRSVYVGAIASSDFSRKGDWQRHAATGEFGNKDLWTTRSRGAAFTYTTNARSWGWVATLGPRGGKAVVYVDGQKRGSVDLHAPYPQSSRVVWRYLNRDGHRHRIQIVNKSSSAKAGLNVQAILVQRHP